MRDGILNEGGGKKKLKMVSYVCSYSRQAGCNLQCILGPKAADHVHLMPAESCNKVYSDGSGT